MALILGLIAWTTGKTHAQTPDKSAAENDSPATTFAKQIQGGLLPCPLDTLINIPQIWSLTPDRLDAAYAMPPETKLKENPYFKWMSTSRTRAVFLKQPYNDLRLDMKLFAGELPVEEVVVDFLNGKLNGITFSLYNRGDSGELAAEEFQRRLKLCGQKMGGILQVRPNEKKPDPTQGLACEGWVWISQRGMALLESNSEAGHGKKAEFLRLRIAPRQAQGIFAAAFQDHPMPAKLSSLPVNVVKAVNGDVYIKDIPMVDQGQKGYCVVASAQRLFEYYGIPVDQHQIAQAAGTSAQAGTNCVLMAEALKKIDYRFKTHFKILGMKTSGHLVEVDEHKMTIGKKVGNEQLTKEIHHYIDGGIPLLWGLMLGKYPEEPAISKQAVGGHMRMLIGYNDKTGHLLFSDSWGAGHELKRMTLDNALRATEGLFAMYPSVN